MGNWAFARAQPPARKSKPVKAQIVVLATLATLATGMLLLFVFIRQALRGATHRPESAEALAQLRSSWRKALGRTPASSLRAQRSNP
jgi:hypothetical protein